MYTGPLPSNSHGVDYVDHQTQRAGPNQQTSDPNIVRFSEGCRGCNELNSCVMSLTQKIRTQSTTIDNLQIQNRNLRQQLNALPLGAHLISYNPDYMNATDTATDSYQPNLKQENPVVWSQVMLLIDEHNRQSDLIKSLQSELLALPEFYRSEIRRHKSQSESLQQCLLYKSQNIRSLQNSVRRLEEQNVELESRISQYQQANRQLLKELKQSRQKQPVCQCLQSRLIREQPTVVKRSQYFNTSRLPQTTTIHRKCDSNSLSRQKSSRITTTSKQKKAHPKIVLEMRQMISKFRSQLKTT